MATKSSIDDADTDPISLDGACGSRPRYYNDGREGYLNATGNLFRGHLGFGQRREALRLLFN